jgi:hypothetical protein
MSGASPAKHLRAIQRRIDWLRTRVGAVAYNATYDKAEIAALEWAIANLDRPHVAAHRISPPTPNP